MSTGSVYRFGAFSLDVDDRRLTRDGEAVDLAPRAFDALALLVREEGRLVPKGRFFAEVWGEVTVGDEALTQCIKTLRRQLGDEASSPRFILTVPKHGYRFVAAVHQDAKTATGASLAGNNGQPQPPPGVGAGELAAEGAVAPGSTSSGSTHYGWPAARRPGIAATAAATALGGAVAGLVGGLLYSVVLIAPADAEVGRTSVTVLLFALNAMVGAVGGLGLGLGYGIASAITGHVAARVAGAALGGLAVGTFSRLLGVDAFNLVLGEGPVGITGGAEGAALSGLVVLGFLVVGRDRARIVGAALGGGIAGLGIVAFGGRLMAGSLQRIAETFSGSDVLAPLAPFFANARFPDWAEFLLGGLEGLVFGGAIGAALILASRRTGG